MINAGDSAPEFTLRDQSGVDVTLSELLKTGPVVLFFYPKAMTAGCTKESCHFRDLASEFAAVGAQRVGISADRVDRQAEFAAKHDFDYPLLSDQDRKVAAAFGVKRPGPLLSRRATFVIGSNGKILASFASELNMDLHADKALEVLAAAQGT